jgi:hypothetical protein
MVSRSSWTSVPLRGSSNSFKLDILLPALDAGVSDHSILLFCGRRNNPRKLPDEHGHADQSRENCWSIKDTTPIISTYGEATYKCNLYRFVSATLWILYSSRHTVAATSPTRPAKSQPSIMFLFFAVLLVMACQPRLASITAMPEPMAAAMEAAS